jgi:hypothetical protein
MDDTRDIAIETRTKVDRLTRTVDDMDSKIDALIKRSDRQDGMAYAGRLMVAGIGAAGGAGATLLMKLLPFTHSLPK